MKAIILAAGKSTRLHPLTLDKPKCLLELEEGMAIIDHQINTLRETGLEEIIVITGHNSDKIHSHLGDSVEYRFFPDFAKYNNMHTLHSIKEDLNDDVVIMYSDVLFGKDLLEKCIQSKDDFSLLVHNKEVLKDTARVKMKADSVVDIGNHIPVAEGHGNFIGIAKYSKHGINLLLQEIEKRISDPRYNNDYYIIPLIELAKSNKIGYELANNSPWIEMDFEADYIKAKNEIYPLIKNQ
ncbi:MAG: phosphocholine cytidylyltransferase family protein [Nanoarchaeota archaeon]|nr:phosphocholine cytidylyltransferase family protein [Nanoarchaeota archaeon]